MKMKSDLISRVPVAIMYVLGILIMLWLGQLTSILLLLFFAVMTLIEFIQVVDPERLRRRDRSLAISLPILTMLLALAVPIHEYFWYALLTVAIVYFTINAIYFLSTSKILYIGYPIWLNALLYIGIPFGILIWRVGVDFNFPLFLIATFVMIWLNDTGAYFVGKAFGKTKLHPKISPGKTVEGLFGGAVCTLGTAVIIFQITGVQSLYFWLVVAIILFLFSVIGDLSESAWKRYYKIKDSGSVLKGHGGFLDRLDSFIYAAPIATLCSIILSNLN